METLKFFDLKVEQEPRVTLRGGDFFKMDRSVQTAQIIALLRKIDDQRARIAELEAADAAD